MIAEVWSYLSTDDDASYLSGTQLLQCERSALQRRSCRPGVIDQENRLTVERVSRYEPIRPDLAITG